MTPTDNAFAFASAVAGIGWLLLAASLVTPSRWRPVLRRLGGRVVPGLLAAGYVLALVVAWPDAPAGAGFGSLAEVAALFSVPGLLLAGWVHYLAFDLLVGRWEIDDSGAGTAFDHGTAVSASAEVRRGNSARWWLLPCLALTFLFGPAGWLLYLLARALASSRRPAR